MTSGYQKCLVLCCVALVAFAFLKDNWGSSARPAAADAAEISSATTASIPSPRATAPQMQSAPNMRTYTNAAFDFSLTYPPDLSVSEYDEGGGTQ
jgi:hypothetical protein